MMTYSAQRTISASPSDVWQILTDSNKYVEWDPNVVRLEGQIELGQKIKIFTQMSPDRAFPVEVTELTPNRRMVWTGGMPLGLFKGVRTFSLEERQEGNTHFQMEEVFSGPLLPIMRRVMPDLTDAFESFANGLKQRAESL